MAQQLTMERRGGQPLLCAHQIWHHYILRHLALCLDRRRRSGFDLSATQEDDASHDSDDHEGEDSEDMDSAAAGPSGEYSQKRGAPCHAVMVGRGGEGRDAKHRILMRGSIDVLNSNEMQWASCCGVSSGGYNGRSCEVYALFR